jgi:methylisocitrate lyase
MCRKISAMAEARIHPDFVIIARTDAYAVSGLDETIKRANAYREAGADVIFPEGLQAEEQFAEVATGSPGHLLANMTEFGKTPIIPLSRFEELGYSIVIFPLSMMRVAMGAVVRGLAALKEDGSVESLLDDMQDRSSLYELLGYTPGAHWVFPGTK